MKKHVRRVLLPLLFSCFFVFSGFLSVNAFASTEIAGVLENSTVLNTTNDKLTLTGANGSFTASFDKSANAFYFVNPSFSTSYINLHNYAERYDFTFAPTLYDYYLVCSFESGSNNGFYPTIREVSMRLTDSVGVGTGVVFTEYSISRVKDTNTGGFTFVGKFPNMDYSFNNITQIKFTFSSNVTIPADSYFHGHFIAVLKSSDSSVGDVVSAINSQTSSLGGKLDGIDSSVDKAADDIQQSIEDQYSGDPETEFSVDDVITQHNEKMGVLSFGSDVMLQFLDMFQSSNVGTAELTLPGFNITVENVKYSVWPDYSFNFEQLNEWVPALMSVIRVMLPAFVWLMVLRYCIKVFEDNFLAK